MDIEISTEPVVQSAVDAPVLLVRKPRTPRAVPALILPAPTMIDGAKDITLLAAVQKKYSTIQFYTGTKSTKPTIVVHDANNPKASRFPGTSMYNFICALANASMGGAGLSPDGSCMYVEQNAKKVLASSPNFGTYIMELVPAGRGGLTSYRATVNEYIALVGVKARILRTSLQTGRTMGRKTRTLKTGRQEKAVQVTF